MRPMRLHPVILLAAAALATVLLLPATSAPQEAADSVKAVETVDSVTAEPVCDPCLLLFATSAALEAAAPVKAAETVDPAPAESACDPSYVGVCIPAPTPDLDCGDVPYRGFRVVGADPHRLDRDKDGLGCEAG